MITLQVSGTEELIRDLRKAGIEVREEAGDVLKEQAEAIKEDAKGRVPVDTGVLKQSIRSFVSKKRLSATVSAGGKVSGGDPYYAGFVEFGTKNSSPHPFLFPAARAHETETEEKLVETMMTVLKNGVGG
ncbi:HK97 gp10 family phage protein [Dethiosulfovibrio sp. F2B]|uniref:HK97-gp10 family putative phage morphogenesis protein n=1 Tax=Dethiosulfovibrio faecalis TaxID=2720018 RepID=UPI001F3E3E5E|nr:HK97-gp10 family putative phage morphogenesis protein [Dethiosulfovibrio faecalis]MCF4152616.1 HK97 gp10 family phage protein [Dethiosulfovibrio faecalis]